MGNKLYSSVSDYLVEGAKSKGYLKGSGKGYGDGKTSGQVNGYGDVHSGAPEWFEGKKSSVGTSAKGSERYGL